MKFGSSEYNYKGNLPATDLPGVKKKSFVLSFAGGEIWFEHLDGMYQYKELVIQKLKNDTKVFLKPSSPLVTPLV